MFIIFSFSFQFSTIKAQNAIHNLNYFDRLNTKNENKDYIINNMKVTDNNYENKIKPSTTSRLNVILNLNKAVKSNVLATLTPRGAIVINSNSSFSTCGCYSQGNGSSSNPYLISNFFIDATVGSGVNISNTNVYFIMQNVWINGSTNYGIYLNQVSNGVFINNTATRNSFGFYLTGSSFNTFTNNSITNNTSNGFYLSSSSSNIFTNNTIANNTSYGFYLLNSNSNTFTNNSISKGGASAFYLTGSNYGIFTSNSAIGNSYGFYLTGSNQNTFTNNRAINNTSHGFYLVSYSLQNNLINNTALNNTQAGFYFDTWAFANTITNNTATKNKFGYYMAGDYSVNTYTDNKAINNVYGFYGFTNFPTTGTNNQIINNNATGNEYGFYLSNYFSLNTLVNNTVTKNGFGFYLTGNSQVNTIYGNIISNNTQIGIVITSPSTHNVIINNIIYDNVILDTQDNATMNFWNANEYGDYKGSNYYTIPGTSRATDVRPFQLDRDKDGMPDWWEELYGLNPLVNDANLDPDHDGYTNLQEYTAGTDPQVPNLYPPPVIVHVTILSNNISWLITSDNASTYSIYSNGTQIQHGNWISGQLISVSVQNFAPGTYNLTIVAFDAYGFNSSHSEIFTIKPTPQPVTTTKTDTITETTGGSSTKITTTTTATKTKTTQGFSIVILTLGLIGVLIIRRKKTS